MAERIAEGKFDVAIIGAGVVGCAAARRFALAGARVIVIEKGPDLLSGASKANSAILHTGFDAPPESLEWQLVRAGREKSVAATKTYTGQMLMMYLLAYALGGAVRIADLERIPGVVSDTLALEPDGTVVAWGGGFSHVTNVPTGLSNVVAVAAGENFCLTLTTNGARWVHENR